MDLISYLNFLHFPHRPELTVESRGLRWIHLQATSTGCLWCTSPPETVIYWRCCVCCWVNRSCSWRQQSVCSSPSAGRWVAGKKHAVETPWWSHNASCKEIILSVSFIVSVCQIATTVWYRRNTRLPDLNRICWNVGPWKEVLQIQSNSATIWLFVTPFDS